MPMDPRPALSVMAEKKGRKSGNMIRPGSPAHSVTDSPALVITGSSALVIAGSPLNTSDAGSPASDTDWMVCRLYLSGQTERLKSWRNKRG